MKIQHPDFPELTKDIESKSAANKWLAAGWVEVKGSEPSGTDPCPTCGATGDAPCVTPSGAETSRHAKRA